MDERVHLLCCLRKQLYSVHTECTRFSTRACARCSRLFSMFLPPSTMDFFQTSGCCAFTKARSDITPPSPPLAARLPPSSSSARAQVSRLPAGLTDRWDKERRFAAAWSLVRELRPSSFLTTSSTPLDGAQGAYESLGAGSELGVVFRY